MPDKVRSSSSKRRSGGRRSKRHRPAPPALGRAVQGVLLVAALVLFAAGLFLGIEVAKPPPPPDLAALAKSDRAPGAAGSDAVTSTPASTELVKGEVSTGDATTPVAADDRLPDPSPTSIEIVRAPPLPVSGAPRLAIVIDDLGRSTEVLDRLQALGVPVTYSVLPFETRTSEVVNVLRRRGVEILCHLPMEPKGGFDPGPGALRLAMTPRELTAATKRAIAAVPGAVGVNNHMGSGISSDARAIHTVLEVIAQEGLFYLDSRTSADTLGYTVARRLGIPASERQVFLDTEQSVDFIRGQVDRWLELARTRGSAIAIAHPYPETLQVLSESVPPAVAAGFAFVPASALLDRGAG